MKIDPINIKDFFELPMVDFKLQVELINSSFLQFKITKTSYI